MWSYLDEENTSRMAELMTDWSYDESSQGCIGVVQSWQDE